jgi:hypothetical protein
MDSCGYIDAARAVSTAQGTQIGGPLDQHSTSTIETRLLHDL